MKRVTCQPQKEAQNKPFPQSSGAAVLQMYRLYTCASTTENLSFGCSNPHPTANNEGMEKRL